MPQPAGVGGRVDLSAHLIAIEPRHLLAQRSELLEVVAQFVEITRCVRVVGHVDHTGALVVAVDAVALDGGFDLIEVVEPEFLEEWQLVGEAFLAVGDTVGQRSVHETAVTSAGRRTDLVAFDQDHVTRRITFLGDDRRPESGVPATHDAQVARLGAHEHWIRLGFVGVLVPIRVGIGIGDRVEVSWVEFAFVAHAAHRVTSRRSG